MMLALLAVTLAGTVPASLPEPQRVVWVSAGAASGVVCTLADRAHWSCAGEPADLADEAVVVIVGEQAVAYALIVSTSVHAMTVRRHGRLLAVARGALAEPADGLHLTASAPDRSPVRPNTTTLLAKALEHVDVLPVSRESIWVAWDEVDDDAFVTLAADGIATVRIPFAAFAGGDVAQPYAVTTSQPIALSGRVENTRGEAIPSTDVELFAPIDAPTGQPSDADILALPIVRIGRATTDEVGAFTFDRVGPGPFVATVTDPTRGRARAIIRSALDAITIRLAPPRLATGRVLERGAPSTGARVRFIPNMQTLVASVDIRDAASIEQQTGDDGRFALPLPPQTAGVVQVIGPDGNATRVPLIDASVDAHNSRSVDLGDIVLPNLRRLIVRLASDAGCVLTAVGPLDSLGIAMVAETAAADNVHWLDLPESGQWAIDADCGGTAVQVVPAVVTVPPDGPETTVDARLARRR